MSKRPSKKAKRPYLFPEDFRLKVVRELESGAISFHQAMSKFQIKKRETLRSWLFKYGKDPGLILKKKISEVDKRKAAYQVIYKEATSDEVAARMGVSVFSISAWTKKYRNEISHHDFPAKGPSKKVQQSDQKIEIDSLRLKVAALEMMIDIAEKEFSIDIRKKPGTKQ